MVTVATVTTAITEAQTIGDTILKSLAALEPEAAVAEDALDLVSQFVTAALNALSAASGTPITVASVQALLPNQTPVAPPS